MAGFLAFFASAAGSCARRGTAIAMRIKNRQEMEIEGFMVGSVQFFLVHRSPQPVPGFSVAVGLVDSSEAPPAIDVAGG